MAIKAVVFDLGGVLIDWDRRHLYRKLFDDEAAMEEFLDTVCDRCPFLDWFTGVLLSADVGVTKPDPRIFAELCRRFGLDPATTLFIDDNPPNVDGALRAGLKAVRFESAATLRGHLTRLG